MKAKLIKKDDHYFLEVEPYTLSTLQKYTIIANTFDKPKGDILQLSLKNCQAIERDYDLEDLATNAADNYDSSGNWHVAYELYKQGFQKALELMKHRLVEETEWDVEIEMDILNEYDKPKLDSDGCLILKRI